MRIFRRGSVYWFELVFEGKRIQRSTKSKNQRLAGQIASTFHTSLVKGEVGITERKPVPNFRDAMKQFLAWSSQEHTAHPRTAMRYQVSSAALLRFFRSTPIDKIGPDEVEKFKTSRSMEKGTRTKRKLRPATVNRELACLKAMFNHSIKGDILMRNPVSRVKFLAEQNDQDRVLQYAEQRKYLAAATPVLRDVANLILETGCRPEEIYTLRVPQVDLERGFLRIVNGKTPAAKRRIELTPTANRILKVRVAGTNGAGYLFPCETDAKRPIPKVNNAHDRALRDSRVAPFRLYDLRHTWATRAAESGIDLVTLAAMMGHSRIQMVMRYAHPTQDHQTNAMKMFSQHVATQEAKEKAAAQLSMDEKPENLVRSR